MSTTSKHQPPRASGGTRTQGLASKLGHFLLHYVEMCLAMCVGAVILSVAFFGGAALIGYPDLVLQAPIFSTLVLAINVSLPMVAWLSEVLDTLEIDSTNLIGASFGGWFTLNYALGVPHRVNKIALLSPAGGLVSLAKQFYVRSMLPKFIPRRFVMESFVRWTTYQENLRDWKTRAIMDCLTDQMYLGTRYFRLQMGIGPWIVFSGEELRGMQVPTLLLIGQEEALYDPKAALERARRLIPDFQGELVPRANHEMTISKHEYVDRRVLGFLKRST